MTMHSLPVSPLRLRHATRALADLIVVPLRELSQELSDTLRRRRGARALYALDDRTLADIGIYRGAIPAAVRGIERRGTNPRNRR
jgi:uncharacterized protein YjiS (DUF1127 family)